MRLPRFRLLPLMALVAVLGIGLGMVVNLDRLQGKHRRDAYRVVTAILALATGCWYVVAYRHHDAPSEPPAPDVSSEV